MPVYPPPSAGGAASNTIILQDEGSVIGTATTLNFVGAGVTATYLSNVGTATIAGGAGGLVSKARAQRTGGNVTISATTYGDVDTGTDLTIAASSGDLLLVGVDGFWQNEAEFGVLDAATIVSAAPVNYISGGGTATNGVMAWRGISGAYDGIGDGVYYVVQAGDISGGNVLLRLRAKTGGGTNKVLRATSSDPLTFWAINLGQ